MYFITVVSKPRDDMDFPNTRTVGIFQFLYMAFDAVETNSCDIWEHAYDYAVIQELEVNSIYPDVILEMWFEFDILSQKYHQTKKPERFKNIIFGLG